MKENSRIKFNPSTKEIEIEGSEGFVTACFDKIQSIISGAREASVEGPKIEKTQRVKKVKKEPKTKAATTALAKKEPKAAKPGPQKKNRKVIKKDSGAKRVTNFDRIVEFVKGSTEGISTAKLKENTGLAESQIWNIVNRATKMGKIKKVKRGLYGSV
jgi:hypothetical protein